MDVDGIGLILGRASELRSKISTYIQQSSTYSSPLTDNEQEDQPHNFDCNLVVCEAAKEVLCNIRDAFQSLEAQLSSLQV